MTGFIILLSHTLTYIGRLGYGYHLLQRTNTVSSIYLATMMVNVVLVSSRMVTFGLVDFEGASFKSFLSRRSRRELSLKARPKILDRLLAENGAEHDFLPTYHQISRPDVSDVNKSSSSTSSLLRVHDAPLTLQGTKAMF